MVDVPEKWQLRQLRDVIEESGLDEAAFQFEPVDQGGSINTAFRFTHNGYETAVFLAEWMDMYDPTARPSKKEGDYHVEMSPGGEGPYEKHNYVAWATVVERFRRWVSYLGREFRAGEDWGQFVQLPRLPPPVPPAATPFDAAEAQAVEPVLLAAETEMVKIVEDELATHRDLEDLRAWLKEEFSEVRQELRTQSKKGFRRTLFGFAANLAIAFGPHLWKRMSPVFEGILRALDSIRSLRGPQ